MLQVAIFICRSCSRNYTPLKISWCFLIRMFISCPLFLSNFDGSFVFKPIMSRYTWVIKKWESVSKNWESVFFFVTTWITEQHYWVNKKLVFISELISINNIFVNQLLCHPPNIVNYKHPPWFSVLNGQQHFYNLTSVQCEIIH